MGLPFTQSDKFEDGSYVPVPNISQHDMVVYRERLQPINSPTEATTPYLVRRKTRSWPLTAEPNKITCLREQIAKQVS